MTARSTTRGLILTGERDQRRTRVVVCCREIWLSDRLFETLCRLTAARLGTSDGFRRVAPVAIRRLRQAFDRACGEGTGAKLIESTAGRRYRLAIEAASISCVATLWRRLAAQRSMWRTLAALKQHGLKSK